MTATITDASWTEMVLTRVCGDLSMMLDREMPVGEIATERQNSRPAGEGGVHISFKLCFTHNSDGRVRYGAVLAPLPDAICMASYLMMASDQETKENREQTAPDEAVKEGLLEVGRVVASGVDGAVIESHDEEWTVSSFGCQGVQAGVRPALPYVEGDELITATMETQVGRFEPFPLLLILPDLAL